MLLTVEQQDVSVHTQRHCLDDELSKVTSAQLAISFALQ